MANAAGAFVVLSDQELQLTLRYVFMFIQEFQVLSWHRYMLQQTFYHVDPRLYDH
jgi:hypothetical protein